MRRTRFDKSYCPIARTSDLIGDWWTPLIMRELVLGRSRFAELQDVLEISKAVLAQRLQRLEADGVVDKVAYQDNPVRYDYRLTEKGHALTDVLIAMWRFGDDWLFRDGAAVELFDERSGDAIRARLYDEVTGEAFSMADTRIRFRR